MKNIQVVLKMVIKRQVCEMKWGGMKLNFIIILFSLLVSSIFSVRTLRNRNNKRLSMLVAFCINALILLLFTWYLFSIDDEGQLFGLFPTDLLMLIFSIPIITWINFFILSFVKSRGIIERE